LAKHSQEIKNHLKERPAEVKLLDPLSAEPIKTQFSEVEFNMAIRLMNYSPISLSILSIMIERAFQASDYGLLKFLSINVFKELSDGMYEGMGNAVICTEDMSYIEHNKLDSEKLSSTYIGSTQLEILMEACKIWPRGIMDDDLNTPVVSAKPVLILSDRADPVTPPANGE